MEFWLWIKDHPWWTAFGVWFFLSVVVVALVRLIDDGDDIREGRSTLGGYVFVFFIWPFLAGMLIWIAVTTPKPRPQTLPSKQ